MKYFTFEALSVSTITPVTMPDNHDFQQGPGTQLYRARHLLNDPSCARTRRSRYHVQPVVPRGAAMNGHPSHASASYGELVSKLHETVLAAPPSADVESIRRAFDVAESCHQGQTRRSGDPYITHPVSVATILAGLGADDQTVCAAILHDTVEDARTRSPRCAATSVPELQPW